MRKQLFQQNTLNVKCHTGNCGNVNLWYYTMSCSFLLSKTALFYSKITLNAP